jgi:hypothetical protein
MMKKLFALVAIFALVFTACGDEDKPENGNGNTTGTTLTIKNTSDYNNLVFFWGDTEFEEMNRGQEFTKTVSAGTRYILFEAGYTFQNTELIEMGFLGIHQLFEVKDVFTCEEGENNQFNFTNTTVVTVRGGDSGHQASGGTTTGTLNNIFLSIENYYLHMDD